MVIDNNNSYHIKHSLLCDGFIGEGSGITGLEIRVFSLP